jgi:hypothetical protein
VTDDLSGVARDNETLLDALNRLQGQGFKGSFTALEANGVTEGARVQCATCRHAFEPEEADVSELRRLEGASDPDDMLAVVALECPRCGTRGSLVLSYGPTATTEEAAVLVALDRPKG